MQMKDVPDLRARWERENQGKKCDHRRLDKEYDLGTQTGDFVCLDCGETFTRAERDKMLAGGSANRKRS